MSWVAAASSELEENAAAHAFLGAASKGKVGASSKPSIGGRALSKGRSSHPTGAPLRTALIDFATKEVQSVIFKGVPPISAVQEAAKAQFKWDGCTILDPEAESPIVNDAAIDIAVAEWEQREEARHADAVEANLESMRSKLASHSIEARELGCQARAQNPSSQCLEPCSRC